MLGGSDTPSEITDAALIAAVAAEEGAMEQLLRRLVAAQREVEWAEHAQATQTLERERELTRLLERDETTADGFVAAFLRPPLYQRDYARGMGTLYTAAYRGAEGRADYFWPGSEWHQSFDRFQPGTRTIRLAESTAA